MPKKQGNLDKKIAFDHLLGEALLLKFFSQEKMFYDDMVFQHNSTKLPLETKEPDVDRIKRLPIH